MSAPREAAGRYLQWRFDHWDEDRLRQHQERRLTAPARATWRGGRRTTPNGSRCPDGRARPLAVSPADDQGRDDGRVRPDQHRQLRKDELVAFRMRAGALGAQRPVPRSVRRRAVQRHLGEQGADGALPAGADAATRPCCGRARGSPGACGHPRVLFALRTNNPAFTEVTALGVHLVYVDYFVTGRCPDRAASTTSTLTSWPGHRRCSCTLAERADRSGSRSPASSRTPRSSTTSRTGPPQPAFDAPVVEIYQGAEGMLGSPARGVLHLNEDCTLVELDESGDTIGGPGAP